MLVFIYQVSEYEGSGSTLCVCYDTHTETGWTNGEGTGLAVPTFQTYDIEVLLGLLFERQEHKMIQVVIREYL